MVRRRMRRFSLLLSCILLPIGIAHAQATTVVPAGNRYAKQPNVPHASASRTRANKTTYEAKYEKVYALLKNDRELRLKIKDVARNYGIDPLHIVGAIVGEHT